MNHWLWEMYVEARRYGMTRLARDTGIERAHLYKTLKPGHQPSTRNLFRIAKVLGFELQAVKVDVPNVGFKEGGFK